MSPSATVGLGVAVFTMAISALLAFATITAAVALLLVRFGTMLVAVAIAVSAMFVPDVVPAFHLQHQGEVRRSIEGEITAIGASDRACRFDCRRCASPAPPEP